MLSIVSSRLPESGQLGDGTVSDHECSCCCSSSSQRLDRQQQQVEPLPPPPPLQDQDQQVQTNKNNNVSPDRGVIKTVSNSSLSVETASTCCSSSVGSFLQETNTAQHRTRSSSSFQRLSPQHNHYPYQQHSHSASRIVLQQQHRFRSGGQAFSSIRDEEDSSICDEEEDESANADSTSPQPQQEQQQQQPQQEQQMRQSNNNNKNCSVETPKTREERKLPVRTNSSSFCREDVKRLVAENLEWKRGVQAMQQDALIMALPSKMLSVSPPLLGSSLSCGLLLDPLGLAELLVDRQRHDLQPLAIREPLADDLCEQGAVLTTSSRSSDACFTSLSSASFSFDKTFDKMEIQREQTTPRTISPVCKAKGELLESDVDIYPVEILAESIEDLQACPRILTDAQLQQLHDDALPPNLQMYRWERCFAIGRDGDSFLTLLHHCVPYQYSLLVIKTTAGDILGGFAAETWKQADGNDAKSHRRRQSAYYGSGQSFLFANHPEGFSECNGDDHPLHIFRWTGDNDYCQICDAVSYKLAMGGVGDFGLIVEENFSQGQSGCCRTYNNPPLVSTGFFTVESLEIYGLAPLFSYSTSFGSCTTTTTTVSSSSLVSSTNSFSSSLKKFSRSALY